MHYLNPIDDAIDKTQLKITNIADKDKKSKNVADFKQLESKIDKEIQSEASLYISEDEEDLEKTSADKAQNEKMTSEKKVPEES